MKQVAAIQHAFFSIQERQMAESLVEELIAKFGEQVLAVILFGSRARGDATDESDMDFLIIMSEVDNTIKREIRFLTTEIWLEHGIFLSTSIISNTHWQQLQKLKTALYCNISDDGIILFQRFQLNELNVTG
ncbi:MAG: hypothetical protein CL608_33795 [Anaerolineaceae bacterium]|nr:hypothetical protein [Anaerolineaceae bacterium]